MAQQTTVKNNVMEQVRTFAEKLRNIEEVRRFRLAEKIVNESHRVQGLIEEIKRTQKELVHADHYAKEEYKQHLERKLSKLQAELDSLPVVREYQQSQVEMNDLLQLIQHVIGSEISKKLAIETGGEVASGCGSGGPCGCR